ncbi:MAG: GGDEF domain-containing protein [Eubacterium sp.]
MLEKQQLQRIIDEERICPVYQPIVSLHDGSVYGYEALSRIALRDCSFNIEEMFSLADREKCLFRLEALCRNKSIGGAKYHPAGSKLFINVTPDVIKDPLFHSGMTLQALGKYGLCASDIIFEITEKKAIRNEEAFFEVIRHYTNQNFQIAIDDFGDGFAGLNRIVVLAPHFLKLDIAMVRNIDADGLKRSLVKGIVDFCRKYSIRVIAEGIEKRSELKTLIGLGVELGQGYFLQRPNPVMSDIPDDVRQLIIKYYEEFNQPDQRMYLWDQIGTIVHRDLPVPAETPGQDLYESFKKDSSLSEFCVVSKGSHVEGLITRRHLMEVYGGLYGYNLYRRRPAGELAEKDALTIDCHASIQAAAGMALSRPAEAVYDAIIVTNHDEYLGMVTIRELLETVVSIQVNQAKSVNPLTGLPGNTAIHSQIAQVIQDPQKSIVYFDLDNFKAYNDNYGFENGDMMLKMMAECIQQNCKSQEFIGHIGGDDMMLISDQCRTVSTVTEILNVFSSLVAELYSEEDRKRGYFIAKNREGQVGRFKIASISAAAVDIWPGMKDAAALMQKITNAKKRAKAIEGNSFVYWRSGTEEAAQVFPPVE